MAAQESLLSNPVAKKNIMISVRCIGLSISQKALLSSMYTLSSLFARATNSTVKNEKRYIKLAQSDPYIPSGRPPTNYTYNQIYTSEIFEDVPDAVPSLLVQLRSFEALDTKMRLSVFYSSNLTGNKEILLASATFTERELLRAMNLQGKLTTDMTSEYCAGAKTHVEVVPFLPEFLDPVFPIVAPARKQNPLQQEYVFYNEMDAHYPYLQGREECWEPKYTAAIPLAFLTNFHGALERSLSAWEDRYELERMRQGRFTSLAEAHARGWHLLEVNVKAARFGCSKEDKILPRTISASNPIPTTPGGASAPPPGECVDGSILPSSVADTPLSSSTPSSERPSARKTANNPGNLGFGKFLGGSGVVKKVDDAAPSSFIEMFVEDRSLTFSQPVGRTNTEYFTPIPVYGSNLNANLARKACIFPIPANDTVHVINTEQDYNFCTYENINRHFIPRRWRGNSSDVRESLAEVSISEAQGEDVFNFHSVQGRTTCFRKYISKCDNTNVSFEFCLESAAGQTRRVGKCSVPLQSGGKVMKWIPVKYYPYNMPDEISIYDSLEILVEVHVHSPDTPMSEHQQIAPDAMREVYQYQRRIDGMVEKPTRASSDLPDYRTVITDCYEWMWYLGFNGHDPLIAESAQPVKATAPEDNTDHHEDEHQQEEQSHVKRESNLSGDRPSANMQEHLHENNNNDSDEEFGSNEAHTNAYVPKNMFESRKSIFETIEDIRIYDGEMEQIDEVQPHHRESSIISQHEGSIQADLAEAEAEANRPRNSTPSMTKESLKAMMKNSASSSSHQQTILSVSTGRSATSQKSRTDVSYPLDWIRTQMEQIRLLIAEIRQIVTPLQQRLRDGNGFRPSPLKKEHEVQPLPINLHYQLLGIRKHKMPLPTVGAAAIAAQAQAAKEPAVSQHIEVIHSVTCGAPSPHMLGHKKGGLFHQEGLLVAQKDHITVIKTSFEHKVKTQCAIRPDETINGPHGLITELGKDVLQFESFCLTVGKRRMYAISQALTIAVNSFLLKINLVAQDKIPHAIAEKWLYEGFLIVFEGLLSVVSNERSMLEDTMSAVDSLRSFQVRILPMGKTGEGNKVHEEFDQRQAAYVSVDHLHERSTSADSSSGLHHASHHHHHHQSTRHNSTSSSASFSLHGGKMPSIDYSEGLDGLSEDFPGAKARFNMKGREVSLYLHDIILEKMPTEYKKRAQLGGAVIKFYPTLFTQGIDIQQTMVTTFGGENKKRSMTSVDLQHYVNTRALREINIYCFKYQPIKLDPKRDGITTLTADKRRTSLTAVATQQSNVEIHPFTQDLFETIRSSNMTMKNVDLLMEVERICLILGGVRVTFCKSGKDRTGMAVTLEQSRQLGERFGCGTTPARVLRDTNLMRVHGTRLMVADKNIGRPVYSINVLQAKFLPVMFRPPVQVCEDIMKKDNS